MTARPDRFAVITDAAIELVAELGMRGLTHRAVDARAGLPLGSTSVYFRTRKALVEAVVRRLADLDRADFEATELPTEAMTGSAVLPGEGKQQLGPRELDQLAGRIAGLLDHWLTAGRTRTLARYACLLEATHHPELLEILSYGIASRNQARALLAQAGAADPERSGNHLVACVDGLLFDRLCGAGSLTAPPPGSEQSRQDLYRAVRTILFATAGISETGAPDTGHA
ncbi:TetR/AcrR family transcriptional regulator [Plantactinospora sp. KLBMP9567]|uniref:TetR/AcrR family transcriptional regulator n=1 Tax=Plantactinospora sp. KLBMP9567 TaxID=3085900 RepID=UPI00298217EE|nr:TetR family transcriptional regulator [Plantactinospora sp. KLBMP9567]MDW5323739.1 TetR family transcriptional regulator [Plantactinospora sp. KLBMP9567]MDW5326859.1 TetR family transcriptional regulator [Plantactinospora sp. KLBMP9567]